MTLKAVDAVKEMQKDRKRASFCAAPASINSMQNHEEKQESRKMDERARASGVKEYARFPPVHHIQISRRKYNLYVSSALPVLSNAYK